MSDTITVRIKTIDSEPMLDPIGMGLLLGVEPDAVRALPIKDGKMPIPGDWIKRGRRRAKEVAAHTGSNTMIDVLRYWAIRDHNATLEVTYE